MTYELWDTSVGTMLALGSNEREIADLIRSLIQLHGDGQTSDLSMSIDDQDGNQLNLLTGSGLAAWADEILDRSRESRERVTS